MNIADYIRKKENNNNNTIKQDSYEEAVQKYSTYSQQELINELYSKGSLSSGNISSQELDHMYERAKGFMSAEQLNQMKFYIEQLKQQ